MSRCYICDYHDGGLSDIPVDGRKIYNNGMCSVCFTSIHPRKKVKQTPEGPQEKALNFNEKDPGYVDSQVLEDCAVASNLGLLGPIEKETEETNGIERTNNS